MRRGQIKKTVLHQRRKRKEKYRRLRKAYLEAKSEAEKERILQKVKRIAPWLSREEFLYGIKKNKEQG